MQAHLDEGLNNTFSATAFAPPRIVFAHPGAGNGLKQQGDLDPGFAAYHDFQIAGLISAYRLIPTAAVGTNPWDYQYGPIEALAGYPGPSAALAIPPQSPAVSM